jgi:hypothetical protein
MPAITRFRFDDTVMSDTGLPSTFQGATVPADTSVNPATVRTMDGIVGTAQVSVTINLSSLPHWGDVRLSGSPRRAC